MKLSDSQYPLKKVFYRMFSLLVVVPLIVVFAAAAVILYQVMRTSAVDTISAFQETVATTLNTDIKSASLQLSYFVYVNDGEFLDVANRVYSSSGSSQQYLAAKELERSFNTAMVPSQNILAGLFFMKGGGYRAGEGVHHPAGRRPARRRLVPHRPGQSQPGDHRRLRHQQDRSDRQRPERRSAGAGDGHGSQLYHRPRHGHYPAAGRGRPGPVRGYGPGRTACLVWRERRAATQRHLQRAALDPDGRTRNYLFILRQVPFTGWRIATFVDEGLIMDRILGIGALLVGVVFSLLLLFFLFSRYFLDAIVMPVQEPAGAMDRVAANDLTVQLQPSGHQEPQRLTSSFNQMVLSLKNMLAINEEAQKRKHQAEMQVLQSQINPHFIVNTLNSIRFMAQMSGYDGTRRMAQALGNIVSCSFRSSTSFYTVDEELQMLDSYLYIMRIRYADGFEVRYDVAEDCRSCRLPRLTLQPIVENALDHGFADMGDELGQLVIQAARQGDFLCLEVEDNGCGMTPEQVDAVLRGRPLGADTGHGIGLKNVLARLRLHFGGESNLLIESVPGQGTRITIRLPWQAVAPQTTKEELSHDPNPDCR